MYVCMYVCVYVCVCVYMYMYMYVYIYIYICVQCRPDPPPPLVGFGFNPPPLLSSPVMWCGAVVVLWVSGLVLNPFPPPCGVVVGVGFRVCTPAPPVVSVVGLFRV